MLMLGLWVAFALPVRGQEGPPPGPATAAPRGLAPGSAQPPEVEAQPAPVPQPSQTRMLAPAAGDRAGSAIEIEDLSAPDPFAVGTLSAGEGGLGANAWAGTEREGLAATLARLPMVERSPVMRDLTRRMLLSQSRGPAGGAEDSSAWFEARLQALNATGLWNDTLALAARAPSQTPGIARAVIDAKLMLGQEAEACAALSGLATPPEGAAWAKLRIYCQIVGGDLAGADLALDVLRETGETDETFFATATALTQGIKPKNEPNFASALHVVMWARAGYATSPSWGHNAQLAAIVFARKEGAAPAARFEAFGVAARLGQISANDWLTAALREPFKADQKDDPEEAAQKLSVAAGDAVHLQAIRARTLPAAKASAIVALLNRGQARNEFPFTAKTLAADAQALAPLPETAWAAPALARILIYNKNVDRAEQWLKALSAGSPSDQPVINQIQLYGWLRDPTPARAQRVQGALDWLADTAAKPGPNRALANRRLTHEGPVLAALEVTLPPAASWARDADSPGIALDTDHGAIQQAMEMAAGRGASGEVILNAAILLQGQGAAAARSQVTATVIRALRAVNLKHEAKALALEALLGAADRPGG
ncbi:MAG TPA: hypothetical protein DCL54_10050 [Alphaproteobacteria bacterium]|nr:hypothetical protein [Alphaproteobacteria bacterium]